MQMAAAARDATIAPAQPIRVMLVDDAAVVRALLVSWLDSEPDMQVVASLRNGREAIEQLQAIAPDVVILDITMPDMDGIAALPQLLNKKRDLIVLMVSTLTRRNAEISLKALSLGAADYIAKPECSRSHAIPEEFRREVIEKIRALARKRRGAPAWPVGGHFASRPAMRQAQDSLSQRIRLRPFAPNPPRVLLIGASTGGPQALERVLANIGRVIDRAPVLIAQHMPPTFTAILGQHLSRASGRPAEEARDGEFVRAGRIYIAPGGFHLQVARQDGNPVLAIKDGPPVNFCKPAVDPLFSSAATIWGSWNLAVVLTGMGADGAHGAAEIAAAGGSVIVQDEQSSVVWGMPGAVAEAGLASAVLPLNQIGAAIARLFAGDAS